MKSQPVIGLEVHVQLATRTKLFCDCANGFGARPNAHTCPVCAGHPGVLPVPNRAALLLGVRAALALGCEIQEHSKFDRKHYFYPDQPKGYQISQYDLPFARGGAVELTDGRLVPLERIHWEEDAGKSSHAAGESRVDLNRAGVPLIEIVGRPALHAARDARDYVETLRRTMRYAGVSDCDMEKGSLRCDVNVSLRAGETAPLGTKVEVKNVNSFRMVERAIDFEIARQAAVLGGGSAVVQETRLWDDEAGETRTMRVKEAATDYRYFPEPDIPPIRLGADEIETERRALPELPQARRRRYLEAGLSTADAGVLAEDRDLADYFEATWHELGDTQLAAKLAANWTRTDVLRTIGETGAGAAGFPLQPPTLAALIRCVQDGMVSHRGARKAFDHIVVHGGTPHAAIDALGLAQISDEASLGPIVREVVAAMDKAVTEYKNGKLEALDALKGRIMAKTKGRANPRVVAELLARLLEPDSD